MVLDADLLIMNMQKLADYIGLPCRIARGCKYCKENHQSCCLVKIDDEKKLSRFDSTQKLLNPPHWLLAKHFLMPIFSFGFRKFLACFCLKHLWSLYVLLTDWVSALQGSPCVCP